MGNFREKFGRRCGQLATLALALASAAPGPTPTREGAQNFLELVGAVPPAPTDITYVTFNSNLGDDTIYHFGRVYELHRLYPEAHIHFVSPLKGQPHAIPPWLDPVSVAPTPGTTLTEEVAHFAREHGGAHSLFLLPDLKDRAEITAFLRKKEVPFDSAMAEAAALSAQMEKLAGELSKQGGSAVLWDLARSWEDPALEIHYALPGQAPQSQIIPGEKIPYRPARPLNLQEHTQYERSRMLDRAFLFGTRYPGNYPKAMVYSPGEGIADFRAWQRRSFKSPGEAHIVVSLNGGGEDKVEALRPQYDSLLEIILHEVWAKDPKANVVVPYPEEQFGPDVAARVREVVAKYPGRVALLPVGRFDMLGAAIDSAHLTIAHDGGPAHIARGIAGPRRVLTFSVNDASLDWRDTAETFAINVDARTQAGRSRLILKIDLAMDMVGGPAEFQYRVVSGLGICEKRELVEAILRLLLPAASE